MIRLFIFLVVSFALHNFLFAVEDLPQDGTFPLQLNEFLDDLKPPKNSRKNKERAQRSEFEVDPSYVASAPEREIVHDYSVRFLSNPEPNFKKIYFDDKQSYVYHVKDYKRWKKKQPTQEAYALACKAELDGDLALALTFFHRSVELEHDARGLEKLATYYGSEQKQKKKIFPADRKRAALYAAASKEAFFKKPRDGTKLNQELCRLRKIREKKEHKRSSKKSNTLVNF